jgi:predicted PurR-regulated permease PerM
MSTARQYRFWLAGLLLALIALYLLRAVLLPFVAGLALAYFLDPLCDRLEKWGCGRALATTIVLLGFGVFVVVVLLLLIPLIQAQIVGLVASLPALVAALVVRVEPLLQLADEHLSPQEMADLKSALGGQVGSVVQWIGSALGTVLSSGLALVNILSLIFITPVVTFYMLRDWDRLVTRVDGCLPREHADVVRTQARLIDQTLAGYARGQATVCLVLGAFYSVGLSLVGLEYGLVVGLLAGVLSFVPYVGTITGFVTSMGLAFGQFSDPLSIGLVLAIFLIGQVLEGYVLTPRLVGDRIGLHPVWVIFALLAGGALFGFVGVLLGLPAAAVVGVLTRFSLARYMESTYYRGQRERAIAVPLEPSAQPPAD